MKIKKGNKKNESDTICVDSLESIGSIGIITAGKIPHLSKDDSCKYVDMTNGLSIQKNPIEWKIDADIDPDKKKRALEDLKDGMAARRVARHLGILADKISRG